MVLREVLPIELLLPAGIVVMEAPPAGFAIVDGDEPLALHEGEGLARFLRAAGHRLDPLGLVLVVVRYRLPTLLDASTVTLVTRDEQLHEAARPSTPPLDLSVADGVVAFTTEFRRAAADGTLEVGVDRWALDASAGELTGTELFRRHVGGARV